MTNLKLTISNQFLSQRIILKYIKMAQREEKALIFGRRIFCQFSHYEKKVIMIQCHECCHLLLAWTQNHVSLQFYFINLEKSVKPKSIRSVRAVVTEIISRIHFHLLFIKVSLYIYFKMGSTLQICFLQKY